MATNYGVMKEDVVLKHPLTRKSLHVRRGDRFTVIWLEDIYAKVKFLEGEAKGKSYVLDRLLIAL